MTVLRRGTPETAREACALLTQAADSGLPTAWFLLGAAEEAGAKGEIDLPGSVRHYRAGAMHGHTGSKTRLGFALLTGRGVARDVEEAETWLRRAANDGDALAAAALGDFHASPERRPPNPMEAAGWYRRAVDLGHVGSAHALARVLGAGAEGMPYAADIAVFLQRAVHTGSGTPGH